MALVTSKNLTVPLSFYAWLEDSALHLHVFAGEQDREGAVTIMSLQSMLADLNYEELMKILDVVAFACASAPEAQAKPRSRKASRRGATAQPGR